MTSTVNVPGKCVGDDSYANGWNKCREAYLPLLAGRDARIAELEADRDSHQRCAIHAMTELAAIKAQEPVEYQQLSRYENWDRVDKAVFELGLLSSAPERFRALYAAPVTEAKAQGELRTERDKQARRIGELEGLLRDCYPGCGLTARQTQSIRERIDAALAAGKEWE